MVTETYMLIVISVKRVRDKQPIKKITPKDQDQRSCTFKNLQKQTLVKNYMPNFHICKVINDKAYDLQDPTGHVRCGSVANVKLLKPAEYIFNMLPDIKAFRWACKYINTPPLCQI